MGSSFLTIALYALGGAVLGFVCGWLIQAMISRRRIVQITNAASTKLDDVTIQRDRFANKYSKSRTKFESLQTTLTEQSTKQESLLKQSKLLAKNVLTLRSERENTKLKLSIIQHALTSLRGRTAALQSEFEKTQEFYKRELVKSLEKRKLLEKEVVEARSEQESFANLLESSTLEHGSTENMVVAAQLRLGQLQVLERNVNKLESENAQLNRDIVQVRQDFEARNRDLAELDKLRIHNKELVRCVETLESSRSEHENEAERYRQQADESEKLSDTLRIRLDDLEKNFADMEEQQDQALEDVRNASVVPMLRKQR